MSAPSDLGAAIREALAARHQSLQQARYQPSQQTVADHAYTALLAIESSMEAMSQAKLDLQGDRMLLMVQLLRASCDHARSMTFLLSKNPFDTTASALVLHRAQIEQLLRGVFFDREATDQEITDFHRTDQFTARPDDKGKKRILTVNQLASFMERHMEMENSGKLTEMVKTSWTALCGVAHGGRALLNIYRNDLEIIGCSVEPRLVFNVVAKATALVNFALSVIFNRANQSPEEAHEILVPAMAAFDRFRAAHESQLARMGPEQ